MIVFQPGQGKNDVFLLIFLQHSATSKALKGKHKESWMDGWMDGWMDDTHIKDPSISCCFSEAARGVRYSDALLEFLNAPSHNNGQAQGVFSAVPSW